MAKNKLKILVINVCLRPYRPQILFPLGLSYVASAIYRAGYEMEILDLDRHRKTDKEIRDFLQKCDFDVVAMGCIVTGYKIIKKLSAMIKEVNKKAVIIVGNSVADSIPEILLTKTKVDVAVIGEGDITIVEILDKLDQKKSLKGVRGIWYKKNGKIFQNPPREIIKDIDSIPFPKWDLFDVEAYIEGAKDLIIEPLPLPKNRVRAFMVNTARGCPFKCSFCYHVFRQYGYRHRKVSAIVAEMKELNRKYGINYVPFSDELSFPTKGQLEEFADRLLSEKQKFFWTASCRSNLFNSDADLPLLKKIKRAGCLGFGYSLESANRNILKAMNKMLDPEDFVRQKKLLDKIGLMTWTSLVFGYPQETKKTIKETMDLCYKLNIYPSCGYLLPQPGTPMYDYLFEKGIVKNEEKYLLSLGDRQDLRINLTKIPSDEFQKEIKKNLRRISKKLKLGLKETDLIKSKKYRVIKKRIKEK